MAEQLTNSSGMGLWRFSATRSRSPIHAERVALGRGVNLASRLESKCPGGEIHVSKKVYDLLREKFVFEYLGESPYKNIQGTAPVYRLVGRYATEPQTE